MGEEAKHVIEKPMGNNAMTQAEFLSWKRRKDENTLATREAAARKRAEDIAAGLVQRNGRELFVDEPWVFDNTQY
ncbi:hypothetical protein LINPERHAP2_LOCUS31590 [Linum perenne]